MRITRASFEAILNTIHTQKITTKEELVASPDLYTNFWMATKNFVRFVCCTKTNGEECESKEFAGNAEKVEFLEAKGVATREDIYAGCVIKIIDKLDLVLREPIEKQRNYCCGICNELVDDYMKLIPPADVEVISLQDETKRKRDSNNHANIANLENLHDLLRSTEIASFRDYETDLVLKPLQSILKNATKKGSGIMEKLFGNCSENIPLYIAFIIAVLLIMVGLIYILFPSEYMKTTNLEFWKIIGPIITGALGYVFGTNSKK